MGRFNFQPLTVSRLAHIPVGIPSFPGLSMSALIAGSYAAYFTDVTQQVIGGPVRTYGFRGFPYFDVTLLNVHTHDGFSWVVDGQTISVTTKTGRLREATTATLASALSTVLPGDTILLRAGTYDGQYAETNNNSQILLTTPYSGLADQRIHLTAYPGETVHFITSLNYPNISAGYATNASPCHFWDISALFMTAPRANVDGGEDTTPANTTPETGGVGWRVVGLDCNVTTDSDLGQLEYGADGWKIFGNILRNAAGRTVNNLAHAIYIDGGADDTEIAYNQFLNRREGFSVMFHQDGAAPYTYTGNWVHHNLFERDNTAVDSRGSISMSNVSSASSVVVEDNWFKSVGVGPYGSDGFGPAICYSGIMTLRRNLFDSPKEWCQLEPYPGGNGQSRQMVVGSGANRNWWGAGYGAGSVQVSSASDGPSGYAPWMAISGTGSTFTVEA